MSKFVVNDLRTAKFVCEKNGLREDGINHSIGVERDGEIIAGIVYCEFNGTNVCLHVASKKNVVWVSRALLKMVFGFAFDGLKVKRITGFVPETNERARNFDERCGFKLDARLEHIFPDGALCVYRMFREDCRWLR